MGIPTSELALIQQDLVAAVCDKTCLAKRPVKTPDGLGSKSESGLTLIETTVCGMRQPTANELTNYAYRIESLSAWVVHLPVTTQAQSGDYLYIENNVLTVHVPLDPHTIPGLKPFLAAELKP